MSKEKWLNDNLCSLHDDKVRIELGPQIIELPCTDANLRNAVTSAHYQKGRIDAYGVVIGTKKKMNCVDWRARHIPKLWKIYTLQDDSFIKMAEFEDKDEALTHARGLI